jgi:hypothetical protein
MDIKHRMIVFDAADIDAESAFWAASDEVSNGSSTRSRTWAAASTSTSASESTKPAW